MKRISDIIAGMDPQEALTQVAAALKKLFAAIDEEARSRFLLDLVGESEGDKVSSMVHL